MVIGLESLKNCDCFAFLFYVVKNDIGNVENWIQTPEKAQLKFMPK